MLDNLRKIEVWLSNSAGFIAVSSMIFMMLSTALDATSRSLFNFPLPGVYEFSEISMAIIVYLGLLWTQRDNKHIRVSLVSERKQQRKRLAWEGLAWSFAAIFLFFLSIPTIEGAYSSFLDREFRWGIIQMPIWWVKIVVAIGLSLACLQMCLHAIISFNSALGKAND